MSVYCQRRNGCFDGVSKWQDLQRLKEELFFLVQEIQIRKLELFEISLSLFIKEEWFLI